MTITKPKIPIPPKWNLSEAELYNIFLVEKDLASRLRNSKNAFERSALYSSLYDEYCSQLPYHPQLTIKNNINEKLQRVNSQLAIISQLMDRNTVFLEIGAGDCSMSIEASTYCKEVIALEVSEKIVSNLNFPYNVRCVIFDGINIPLKENSLDLAYSNQLMEHLHPEDALDQLKKIRNVLKKGGSYICITPNKITGPHDISRFYTDSLVGFHLKEYSSSDLRVVFKSVGFSKVQAYTIVSGHIIRIPFFLILCLERVLLLFSKKIRKKLLNFKLLSIVFNAIIKAIK